MLTLTHYMLREGKENFLRGEIEKGRQEGVSVNTLHVKGREGENLKSELGKGFLRRGN